MAAGPVAGRGDPGVGPPRRRPRAAGVDAANPLVAAAGPRVALGVLRQRADRDRRDRARVGRLAGWETPRREGRVDVARGRSGSAWPVAALVGLTLRRLSPRAPGHCGPATVSASLLARRGGRRRSISVIRGLRVHDPFLDPQLFRSVPFSSAALVSLLTGYGFATAIMAGRCSSIACSTAVPTSSGSRSERWPARRPLGALVSGFAVRVLSLRLVTVVGLALSIGGLVAMAAWDPNADRARSRSRLGVFGLWLRADGDARGRPRRSRRPAGGRSGWRSAVVTVARMIGMAVGLAILTAYGSTTIDRLADQVYATPEAYLEFIPRRSGTGRCATRSWWRRSRNGRPGRRRRSWSGCSWSPPGSRRGGAAVWRHRLEDA